MDKIENHVLLDLAFTQTYRNPILGKIITVAGYKTAHSAFWGTVVSLKNETQERPGSHLCSSSDSSSDELN